MPDEPDPFVPDEQSVADRLAAEALIVDVDGFEGPLDLLLTLSRTQKVDLRKVSVLALARQYLSFVDSPPSCATASVGMPRSCSIRREVGCSACARLWPPSGCRRWIT